MYVRQGIIVREAALAGDLATVQLLCNLYSTRLVRTEDGRTTGGVPLDIRGAAYIVAVARSAGSDGACALGATQNNDQGLG